MGKKKILANNDEVWETYQLKLEYFIRSRVKDSCIAKDILHDTYLKFQNKIHTVKDPKKVGSWLYQIGRNTIIDYYRSHKKTMELPENIPSLKNQKNAWSMISECVRPFIEKLPKIYREALVLSEIEGLNHKQVAKKLNITLATTKSRIQRGRQKLKKEFEDCCIFECGPKDAQIHDDGFEKLSE